MNRTRHATVRADTGNALKLFPTPVTDALLGACWVLAIASLGGCERHTSQVATDAKVRVLCAVYPFADLVKQIGGEHVEVDWVCESGQDPRDVQVTDDLRHRLAWPDLVVSSGYGDAWLTGGIRFTPDANRIIRPELTDAGRTRPMNAADQWLDPLTMQQLVTPIRDQLSIRLPQYTRDFSQNADAMRHRLEALHARISHALEPFDGYALVEVRPCWTYFAERYGLTEVSPVDSRADKLTDPDARAIRKAANDSHCPALFIDAYLPRGLVRELERQTRLKTVPLDRTGSRTAPERQSYEALMDYNVAQLVAVFRQE